MYRVGTTSSVGGDIRGGWGVGPSLPVKGRSKGTRGWSDRVGVEGQEVTPSTQK